MKQTLIFTIIAVTAQICSSKGILNQKIQKLMDNISNHKQFSKDSKKEELLTSIFLDENNFLKNIITQNGIDISSSSLRKSISNNFGNKNLNALSSEPYPTILNITSSIPVLNKVMNGFMVSLEDSIQMMDFPPIEDVRVQILTTSLTINLDNLKVAKIVFDPKAEYIFKPQHYNITILKIPDIDLKATADYKFIVKEGKKEPQTLTGTMELDFSKLGIEFTIDSNTEDKEPLPSIFFKVSKYSSKWDEFNASFSDEETEKIWNRLFNNKIAKQAIMNIVVKKMVVEGIDETDFSQLLNLEFHDKYNITAGFSGHSTYPLYWPETGTQQVRGFTLPLYVRVLDTTTQTLNPLLFNMKMDHDVTSWDQMTIGVSSDLFNTILFGLFESDILDISINDKITHDFFPFNTENIRFLFPNIVEEFTGKKSIILELKTHDWSPQTANFRTINGRLGMFLELDMNWFVYDNPKEDPSMTVKKCGSKCVKFVTLTTKIFITFGLGIDNNKSKVISLGWLNLDIGGLIVKDPLFEISQERLFTFMNSLVDSLILQAPNIPIEKFLEKNVATIDILKDQRINFEITPKEDDSKDKE